MTPALTPRYTSEPLGTSHMDSRTSHTVCQFTEACLHASWPPARHPECLASLMVIWREVLLKTKGEPEGWSE